MIDDGAERLNDALLARIVGERGRILDAGRDPGDVVPLMEPGRSLRQGRILIAGSSCQNAQSPCGMDI